MHDLKSRLNAATHIYNPSKPPFEKGGLLLPYGNPAVAGDVRDLRDRKDIGDKMEVAGWR